MDIFKIDGQSYNVGVKSIKREAPFLDKYANRTENGDVKRDLIGVYRTYTLTLVPVNDVDEYERLYNKLTEPVDFHNITVPDTTGTITYKAYVTTVSDDIKYIKDGIPYWGNLQVKFIAKSPI